VAALHTAARRFCASGAESWEHYYSKLHRGQLHEEYDYTTAELDTFPRYHVLHAILAEVERSVPSELASLAEARVRLARAGESAESLFTENRLGPVALRAMAEERARFVRYVRTIPLAELEQVELLPFRRVLEPRELERLWAEVEARWAFKGAWYPCDRPWGAEPPAHTVAFAAGPFSEPALQQSLREALPSVGARRIWELRELPTEPSYELDLALLHPVYNGSEGFWLDNTLSWLVYASHEDSVTIGGPALLPALQAAWPNWQDHLFAPDW
jgi:hypothetical protein